MQESFWWWQCSDRYISLSPTSTIWWLIIWWFERVVRRHVDHIQRRHTDQPKEAERLLPPPEPEATHFSTWWFIWNLWVPSQWMIKLIQSCPQSELPKRQRAARSCGCNSQSVAIFAISNGKFPPIRAPVRRGFSSHSKIEDLQNTWKTSCKDPFRILSKTPVRILSKILSWKTSCSHVHKDTTQFSAVW